MLEGEDITPLPPHKRVQRGLARTFQINQLFADLTPLETVGLAVSERLGYGSEWWRVAGSRTEVIDEATEILSRFGLADVMGSPTHVLPYGRQRLLEIAVAIASKPRVLLLDEPAAGVPEEERHEILAIVGASAGRRDGAADRARHGSRLRLRRPHQGAGQWRAVRGGHDRRDRARSARARRLSRGGRR